MHTSDGVESLGEGLLLEIMDTSMSAELSGKLNRYLAKYLDFQDRKGLWE